MDLTTEGTLSSANIPGRDGVIKKTFHWVDYLIFALLLGVSAAIGIFFAIRDKRRKHVGTQDYLMAGRKMTYGPVTMSLIASFMSSITILGVPAEYYVYGTMFTWFILTYAAVTVITGWVYMPVFYDLKITSTYEYVEQRFNRATKYIVTIMYFIQSLMYGGIVVYGPALALSEATGFDLWIAILSTGIVCVFYTALGGLKAVIWTDVVQSIMMITGFLAVIIQGSINHGGFGNIWNAAAEGQRIDFVHFEADPRIRHTFWSILFGGTVFWIGINGVNHAQVQRYVCIRTKRDAQKAIVWNGVGLVAILVLAGMTGLTIYATYKHCDPINSKAISSADQLFPYVVMDTLSHLPGMPGLFVAGVYSSSLSTISSGMNALACIALQDFVKPHTNWTPRTYLKVSKIFVVAFGVTYIILAYLASVVGGLIRMGYSLNGIVSGPIVGVFTVGMVLPFVNSWGAIGGALAGLTSTIWVVIGSVAYPPTSDVTRPLPRSTDGCAFPDLSVSSSFRNATKIASNMPGIQNEERPAIADFYSLSYIYISLLGFIVTTVAAILISTCTGLTKKNPPDPKLLIPLARGKPTENHKKNVEKVQHQLMRDEKTDSWSHTQRPGASFPASTAETDSCFE